MNAVNHFIIIDKIKEAPKTVGGLEITQNQNHDVRYLKGNIISVGDKIDFLKEGDVVRYDKHAGHGIQYNDTLYYVIKVSDIVIIE